MTKTRWWLQECDERIRIEKLERYEIRNERGVRRKEEREERMGCRRAMKVETCSNRRGMQ